MQQLTPLPVNVIAVSPLAPRNIQLFFLKICSTLRFSSLTFKGEKEPEEGGGGICEGF